MQDRVNPPLGALALRGFLSGARLSLIGMLLGAAAGAVIGWSSDTLAHDDVERALICLVYALVGALVATSALACLATLETVVTIVRVKPRVGIPLTATLAFVTWKASSWLWSAGFFATLSHAHPLAIATVAAAGLFVFALGTFFASLVSLMFF